MIRFPEVHFDRMIKAVEAAYPDEGCGLLAGVGDLSGGFDVRRIVPSRNVTTKGTVDSFEVDPKVRFDLMRELGEIGPGPKTDERLIGHFHSHPDHPAMPSQRDLDAAFEPEMIWVIIGVANGKTDAVTAHVIDAATGAFRQIALRRPDGVAYAQSPDPTSKELIT